LLPLVRRSGFSLRTNDGAQARLCELEFESKLYGLLGSSNSFEGGITAEERIELDHLRTLYPDLPKDQYDRGDPDEAAEFAAKLYRFHFPAEGHHVLREVGICLSGSKARLSPMLFLLAQKGAIRS